VPDAAAPQRRRAHGTARAGEERSCRQQLRHPHGRERAGGDLLALFVSFVDHGLLRQPPQLCSRALLRTQPRRCGVRAPAGSLSHRVRALPHALAALYCGDAAVRCCFARLARSRSRSSSSLPKLRSPASAGA
jgi:hypothetical protein